MSDTLSLLYTLPCINVTFFNLFFFFAYHFFGKNVGPPPLFVTEIHNYGCADITSLNEMLTCSWDKHSHVFSFQLAPSIRFYILLKSELSSDAEEEPNIEGRASLCVRNRHR